MDNFPKISVIIPVYNVEKYLRKCLDSVINQTYTNLEIICVNDGSPDNSLAILNEYAAKDKRIIIINQENSGVSVARNRGLEIATGEYIAFVDSDDYLELNLYEQVVKIIIENPNIELVQWSAKVEAENNISESELKTYINWYSIPFSGIMPLDIRSVGRMFYSPWTSLFRKSIIDKLQLRYSPKYTVCEDALFTAMYLAEVNNIFFIKEHLYNYLLRTTSATKNLGAFDNPTVYLEQNIGQTIDCYKFYELNNKVKKFIHLIYPRFTKGKNRDFCLANVDFRYVVKLLINLSENLPKNMYWDETIDLIRKKQFKKLQNLISNKQEKNKTKFNTRNFAENLIKYSNTNTHNVLNLMGIKIKLRKTGLKKGNTSNTKSLKELIKYKKQQLRNAIFSSTNTRTHKIIRIMGFKIKLENNYKLEQYISNEVFAASIIRETHTRTILPFKECNIGNSLVVVACGPTMAYYKPLENHRHLGVNKAFKNSNIKLDYMFTQDNNAIKDCLDEFLNYPCIKFIGSFLTKQPHWIKSCIIPEIYRNRKDVMQYFSSYPRELAYPYLECYVFMDFTSVIFPAMQFALYTQPKRIYLVGCDCSYDGYFDGSKQNQGGNMTRIIQPWRNFKPYCDTYYPNVEIISINPVGLRGLFKDVYTREYVQANPQKFKDMKNIKYLDELEPVKC